jgi:hypothetical protein
MTAPEHLVRNGSTPEASACKQTIVHEPSQRRVVFDFANERGEIEVRTQDGALELRITLTDSGPVLSVAAARIELVATETVAVRCRSFEVETTETMRLRSAGPIEVKAMGDLRLDGDQVFLNCEEGFRGDR